jgi:hypothetical protein
MEKEEAAFLEIREYYNSNNYEKPLELLDKLDSLIGYDNIEVKEQIEQLRMRLIALLRIRFEDEQIRQENGK